MIKYRGLEIESLYLSGAVTGIVNNNREAFERTADILSRKTGCRVEIPHDHVPSRCYWPTAMKLSVKAMMSCDGVAMMPGFTSSRGAMIEKDLANSIEMPCLTVNGWLHEAEKMRGGGK